MNLLPKTTLIVAAAVGLGLLAIFGVAGTVLIDDFKAAEEQAARQDALRVAGAVEDDLADLEWNARELAGLAAAVFPEGLDEAGNGTPSDAGNGTPGSGSQGGDAGVPVFDNATLQLFFSLFAANRIDAVAILFDNTTIGFTLDFDSLSFVPVDEAINASLLESGLFAPAPPGLATSLVLHTSAGSFLAASYPLNGAGVAVLRALDDAYVEHLAAVTGERVRLEHAAGTFAIERHDWSTMTVHAPVGDAPLTVLIEQDRTLFRNGIDSITYFFVASLFIAAALLTAGLLTLRFAVTGRVRRLERRMHQIRADQQSEVPAFTGHDEVTALAAAFEDLLATLKEREERLEQSNRDLQSFARVVTHDLQSPLSTFALNLHLLRVQAESARDADEIKRIERMERTVAGMESRIKAILEYSRSRDADPAMGRVELGDVMGRVLDDLAAQIEASGARVDVGTLPAVRGDAAQLEQLFQNLISNALKFVREGQAPVVRVWAEPGPTGWAIHVEDQGIGFLPEQAGELFKPFTRLEGVKVPGHGVGLATCARIAERHGGRIHAQGVPGKGARFTVLLHADTPPAGS